MCRSEQLSWLPPLKNFIQAKYDFVDKMLTFGNFSPVNAAKSATTTSILDVGCGIGGTSR